MSKKRRVTITTPARLHFALIDLNGSLGRIDGGIGLAINEPHFEIVVELSNRIQVISTQYQKRAYSIITQLQKKYGFPGIRLKLESEIPSHSGFGSGTQLALGIAQAVNTLYNLNLCVADLALTVGRGGTSGIGIAAFEQGGFILDGGHRFPDQKSSFLPSSAAGNVSPPPLLLRYPFPDWELLIVIPYCTHISGEMEVDLFKTLCPQPRTTAEQLSHLILLRLLPAVLETDRYAFGDAVNRIQTFGWKKAEIDAQGHILQKTLDFLRDNGALGAGVSSWGPAIFVVSEDLPDLKEATVAFLDTLQEGGTCFITQANNVGAKVDDSGN